MRLSRPVYEGLPLLYMGVGGLAILLAYVDPAGLRPLVAFSIGMGSEIAGLTVFLRRQNYREMSRHYSRKAIDAP